jgi:hypothetical protein
MMNDKVMRKWQWLILICTAALCVTWFFASGGFYQYVVIRQDIANIINPPSGFIPREKIIRINRVTGEAEVQFIPGL